MEKNNKEDEKQKENRQRADRLHEEIHRVYDQDFNAKKLAKKLGIPEGTASGLYYKGSMPSITKAVQYAKKLGIDAPYWIMGIRLTVNHERLADSISLVEKIMSDRPNEEFTVGQVSYMISLVYNSSTTICETVINSTMDIFCEQNR